MLMIEGAQFAGFIAAAAFLVVTPGPNTLLILTNSAAGGRSAGMATVPGVETGTLIHPERGHEPGQVIVFGATVAVIGVAFGSILTVAASRAHARLRHGVVARWRERLTGSVLIGLSVRLVFTQRN